MKSPHCKCPARQGLEPVAARRISANSAPRTTRYAATQHGQDHAEKGHPSRRRLSAQALIVSVRPLRTRAHRMSPSCRPPAQLRQLSLSNPADRHLQPVPTSSPGSAVVRPYRTRSARPTSPSSLMFPSQLQHQGHRMVSYFALSEARNLLSPVPPSVERIDPNRPGPRPLHYVAVVSSFSSRHDHRRSSRYTKLLGPPMPAVPVLLPHASRSASRRPQLFCHHIVGPSNVDGTLSTGCPGRQPGLLFLLFSGALQITCLTVIAMISSSHPRRSGTASNRSWNCRRH